MTIKVVGAGCSSCSQLFYNVERAVEELKLDLEVEFIHDIAQALTYEVLQMPALIINEQVVSSGKDLSVGKVKKILQAIDN